MVVHLEGGVAATACEADNVVLAVVYRDGGLVDSDVVRPHVENDADFALVLQGGERERDHSRATLALALTLCLTVVSGQEVTIKPFWHTWLKCSIAQSSVAVLVVLVPRTIFF